MNLLADEGVDAAIVAQLRLQGHTVLYVAEMEPGISDETVLERANTHGALLVTADKDFGELVYRQGLVHLGVVLVRLAGLTSTKKGEIVADAITQRETEVLNAFTVISPGLVRIRKKRD
jgi:predicted nuclease of predicted toxin-antitoxin system